MKPRNPMQPLVKDQHGTVRFKGNAIVEYLLECARVGKSADLNHIARLDFTQDDRCQFAQLIGYSLSGYHELSYVSDEHAMEASAEAHKQWSDAGGCRDTGCEIHCGVPCEET